MEFIQFLQETFFLLHLLSEKVCTERKKVCDFIGPTLTCFVRYRWLCERARAMGLDEEDDEWEDLSDDEEIIEGDINSTDVDSERILILNNYFFLNQH